MGERLKRDVAGIVAPHARDDERLAGLLALSVGRILCREGQLSGGRFDRPDDEKLRHIADWLKAALVNDAPWLSNLDEDGHPKKLMKLHSIAACTAEADKEMLKSVTRRVRIELIEGDEEHYADLQDGCSLVRLLTPASLDREGAAMQHCIGDGAYDEGLDDETIYLSLRDPAGKPHATLEVQAGRILQLQGKQNKVPIQRYLDLLILFLKETKWEVAVPANRLGHVIDVAGDWYPIDDLPEGLSVGGDLELSDTPITALPQGLDVGGDLDLFNTSITALPEGLSVGGSLILSNSSITALPEGLSVGGDLDLANSSIMTLPEGLSVRGDLNLANSSITALPEGLSVGRDLNLSNTPITALPEGLSVGGRINLFGTHITVLPEGLSVGGDLNLGNSSITALPEGLSVGRNLDLSNTPITTLPEGLSVRGRINIANTSITALPQSIPDDEVIVFDAGMTTAKKFRELHGTISEMPPRVAF